MYREQSELYDVAVIGGGPAGMMAAIASGQTGAKTALLEKNSTLGKKLLLTGKGRSNLTRAEFNSKELARQYGREGGFLIYPFSIFGVKETIEFFEKRGLRTKIERGRRIFPQSDRANDVLGVLFHSLKESKIKIISGARIKEILGDRTKILKIVLENDREIIARNYIIATGGKSYPMTGSSGDGYQWAENLGHTVNKLRPALVALRIKERWPKKAQGLSLKNVELSVFQNDKKKDGRFGEMLFTHFGISGPIVLDLSSKVGELLEKGEVKLSLDLKPALDLGTLERRIQSDFLECKGRVFKNSLSDLLPRALIPVIVELSGTPPLKNTNDITREEKQRLARLLKSLEMTVQSLLGFETAIITAGGISLKEIDSRTMKSKLVDNLFFAGEIIDLHGPTGGYNLQLCWSTGHLAGESAATLSAAKSTLSKQG